MSKVEDVDAAEDPRTAAIVRRMRLFVGISTAVMALGFLLVMSVIVWRLVKQDDRPANGPGTAEAVQTGVLPVAPGSHITGTASDGTRLFVTVEEAGGVQAIHVFSATTLEYRGRIAPKAP